MSEPDNQLDLLAAAIRQHLLSLLEDALDASVERHRIAEGRGADEFSFGTDAWSLPARRFRDCTREDEVPFKLLGEPGCVLKFGSIRLRHHRVGESEVDDIWQSFPGNAKAAGEEAAKQLALEFYFRTQEMPRPPQVGTTVLAYMANPTDGLCAAYLTTIRKVQKRKITAWSSVVELYRRDRNSLANLPTKQRPPPETSPEVEIRLNKKPTPKDDFQASPEQLKPTPNSDTRPSAEETREAEPSRTGKSTLQDKDLKSNEQG